MWSCGAWSSTFGGRGRGRQGISMTRVQTNLTVQSLTQRRFEGVRRAVLRLTPASRLDIHNSAVQTLPASAGSLWLCPRFHRPAATGTVNTLHPDLTYDV